MSRASDTQWRRFAATAAWRYGAPDGDYADLWQCSVHHPARFWRAVWDFFELRGRNGTAPADGDAGVLAQAALPGAEWFPGVELNHVDHVLRHANRALPTIIGVDENDARTEISWADLPGQIGAVASALGPLGGSKMAERDLSAQLSSWLLMVDAHAVSSGRITNSERTVHE